MNSCGIGRAQHQVKKADCILWLGTRTDAPPNAVQLQAKNDLATIEGTWSTGLKVSAISGEGMEPLRQFLLDTARQVMPKPGAAALNARQYGLIGEAATALDQIGETADLLIIGEHLRTARNAFDRLTGAATTEDMLDTLFGRFCIGK